MVQTCSLAADFVWASASRLISLAPSNVAIVTIYLVMVLGIGMYLRRYANISNDFFMAGREMTARVAGPELSFRQSWRHRTDGLGSVDLSIRHSGRALLLDRGLPFHALSGPGNDAVLLHLKDALGPAIPATAIWRIIRLFTEPKWDEQLCGLVWGATHIAREGAIALWKKPIF